MVEPRSVEEQIRYQASDALIVPAHSELGLPEELGLFGVIRCTRNVGNYLHVRFGLDNGKWVVPLRFMDVEDEFEIEITQAESVADVLHSYLRQNQNARTDSYTFGLYRALVMAIGTATRHNAHHPAMDGLRERTGNKLFLLAAEADVELDISGTEE